MKRGEAVLAPIPAWLLEPRGFERLPVIDIRAQLPEGFSFATGLPKVGDAWRLAGTRVGFAGYSAIGRFTLEEIAVPAPGALRAGATREDGVLRLAVLDGFATGTPTWSLGAPRLDRNQLLANSGKQMLVRLVPVAPRVGWPHGVGRRRAVAVKGVGSPVDPPPVHAPGAGAGSFIPACLTCVAAAPG